MKNQFKDPLSSLAPIQKFCHPKFFKIIFISLHPWTHFVCGYSVHMACLKYFLFHVRNCYELFAALGNIKYLQKRFSHVIIGMGTNV